MAEEKNLTALGLDQAASDGIVAILSKVLADEVVLYTKLRKFHWNVTGPNFLPLHELFEDQYDDVADVIDTVAELIRQYGAMAPGTLTEFQKLTRLKEAAGKNPAADAMVAELAADHEALVRHLRADLELIDEDYGDDVASQDVLTSIMEQHMKFAWMLRASLPAAASVVVAVKAPAAKTKAVSSTPSEGSKRGRPKGSNNKAKAAKPA
jgi:starvation-inducible DNA-binding protein